MPEPDGGGAGHVGLRTCDRWVGAALSACAGKTGRSVASEHDEPLPVLSAAARFQSAAVRSSGAGAEPHPAPDPIPPGEQTPGSLDQPAMSIAPARTGAFLSPRKIVARTRAKVQPFAYATSLPLNCPAPD